MKKRIEVNQSEGLAIAASFLPTPIIAVLGIVAYLLNERIFAADYANISTIIMLILAFLCCIPHEALHGAGWILFGKRWSDMHFGVRIPFAAYIKFDGEMKMGCFRFGLLLPFIITSILPMIIGTVTGNFYLFVFGAIQATGCGSDVLSAIRSLKFETSDTVVDDAGVTGFVVLKESEAV